ncbi:AMP-binding protein [Pseudarthrobacter sp. NPDC058329]|uniref:AMP-binding protein n=1 Tax=Pseudarthrobacter sp. NPDC058329 TaxID=3346448 RepID=UPI0036DF9C19
MRGNYAEIWRCVAEKLPEKTAIVAGEVRISYGEFDRDAAKLASLFVEHGLHRGSKIAIYMHNRAEYLIALYAAFKIGAVPVTINFRYREREVLPLLENCEASALIFTSSMADTVMNMRSDSRLPATLLQVNDLPEPKPREGVVDFREFESFAELSARNLSNDDELLIYTGGTTGRPKAVVWSVGDLLDIQMFSIYGALGLKRPSTLEEVVSVATDPALPDTVTLPLAPFMHATALFNAMNTFVLGGTLVILPSPSFDPSDAANVIVSEAVTRLILAGDAVAQPLIEALHATGETHLPSLRTVISSGMRFSDESKRQLHALGDITIADILASTEGGPYAIGISTSGEDLPARLRLAEGAVVLSDSMEEVQDRPGQIGVLAYKGTLPKGYFKDEEKTRQTYPVLNGVRHVMPGDFVEVKVDHYIELLGRGSSVVNSGGEKIFPAEVEETLMSHEAVIDAVAFGMPDKKWGEALTAIVAVNAGSQVTEQELASYVGAQLAGFKKPKRILIKDSLERSPSGKLDMSALKVVASANEKTGSPDQAR